MTDGLRQIEIGQQANAFARRRPAAACLALRARLFSLQFVAARRQAESTRVEHAIIVIRAAAVIRLPAHG